MKKTIFGLCATIATFTSLFTQANTAHAFTLNPNYSIQSRTDDPTFNQFLNGNITDLKKFIHTEAQAIPGAVVASKKFNASSLKLKYDHDVKVYFLGEGAGYQNELDFSVNSDARRKIFGDASCLNTDSLASQFCPSPNGSNGKTGLDKTLKVGDFVKLGSAKAGDSFDFQVLSNQVNGGIWSNGKQGIFGLDSAKNPDGGLQHVMSYFYKDYLILAYEDLWGGGDKDYNDVVIAVDFGQANNKAMAGIQDVPESSNIIGLFGIAALGFGLLRSRKS